MDFVELIQTPKLENVILHSQLSDGLSGTLVLTFSHLIFSSKNGSDYELWLLHQSIDTVERKPIIIQNQMVEVSGKYHQLIIKCSDLRIITIEIATSREFLNVAYSIEQLSGLKDPKMLYPFHYRPMYSLLENGFIMFRPEIEFSKLLAGDEWRITNVNKNYDVCQTYSAVLIVPKAITDEQIIQSASFREAGRFPLLSYKHSNGAVLMKSAQPSALSTKRCRSDEALLNLLLGKSKKGFIVDTWGGKTSGKSNNETDQHYSQWKKVSRPIGNFNHPSGILDSFSKLIEACNDTNSSSDKWLSRLESSGWLSLVLNSLNTSCIVAQCLEQEGAPVLVHGGKGLDSTLIVTSIVQITLNPDCRTVRGLQALIDREWLQSGHPFASRHSQSCYTLAQNRLKTSGATFALFLDCVFQLYSQFPCSFEFDSNLLVILFEHSYFSQYGSFLGDSECERSEIMAFNKTTSLWSHLNRPDVMKSLLNPAYEPNPAIIWPSVAPLSLVLWSDLYLRFVIENVQSKKNSTHVQSLVNSQKELRSKVVRLRKQLMDLHKEYQELQSINCTHQENQNNNNTNNHQQHSMVNHHSKSANKNNQN